MKRLALSLSVIFFFAFSFQAQTTCPNPYDGNSDDAITVYDILGLLSIFGELDSDSDGVWDSIDECVDLSACNFASNPTEPCASLDIVGVCGGDCQSDVDNDGVCDPVIVSCGLIAHEGYNYSTVQIGDQCWFAENCRYLPSVSPSSASSNSTAYHYVYGYEGTDVLAAQSTSDYSENGVIYNWTAAMQPGTCPTGWHIPSDLEWQALEIELGISATEAQTAGWRGTNQGTNMKSTTGWIFGGNGNNSSGFNGFPGGIVYSGGFELSGSSCYWWSSSPTDDYYAWIRHLKNINSGVFRNNNDKSYGFSVRCLMD